MSNVDAVGSPMFKNPGSDDFDTAFIPFDELIAVYVGVNDNRLYVILVPMSYQENDPKLSDTSDLNIMA